MAENVIIVNSGDISDPIIQQMQFLNETVSNQSELINATMYELVEIQQNFYNLAIALFVVVVFYLSYLFIRGQIQVKTGEGWL